MPQMGPISNRLDSGPQIFRNSFEFHPNGNATHPTIMLIAANEKSKTKLITIELDAFSNFGINFGVSVVS